MLPFTVNKNHSQKGVLVRGRSTWKSEAVLQPLDNPARDVLVKLRLIYFCSSYRLPVQALLVDGKSEKMRCPRRLLSGRSLKVSDFVTKCPFYVIYEPFCWYKYVHWMRKIMLDARRAREKPYNL